MPPRLLRLLLVAVLAWTVNGTGLAQTRLEQLDGLAQRNDAIRLLLILSGVFAVTSATVLVFLASQVQKTFWNDAARVPDAAWRTYLMQLPLGAPEGSIRALISIYVIVFGLLVLVMQKQLGLDNVEAMSGFVGIVITFYFTTRSGEQTTKAVGTAVDAAEKVTNQTEAAVARSQGQIGDAVAATQQATAAVQSAATAVQQIGGAGAGGPADAAIAQGQSGLQRVKADLQITTQVLDTLGGIDKGAGIIGNVATLTRTAGGVVDMIDPLLSGKPDSRKIGEVLNKAQDVLGTLQGAGLPGVLGDAVAGIGGTLGALAPIVSGLTGGPAGLVGGIIVSGIKLYQQSEQFEAWKTALLRKPFSRSVMPPAVDGTAALAALDPTLAPLMAARVGVDDPALATGLMREMLRTDDAGEPLSSVRLAAELFAPEQELGLHDEFHSQQELTEAIAQYRGGLAFVHARARLQGSIDVPVIGDQPARRIDLAELVTAGAQLAVDPRAGGEIERLVYIVEALGKLGFGPDRLLGLATGALDKAANLATQDREQTDHRQ